jgi:hypothetical protein
MQWSEINLFPLPQEPLLCSGRFAVRCLYYCKFGSLLSVTR